MHFYLELIILTYTFKYLSINTHFVTLKDSFSIIKIKQKTLNEWQLFQGN